MSPMIGTSHFAFILAPYDIAVPTITCRGINELVVNNCFFMMYITGTIMALSLSNISPLPVYPNFIFLLFDKGKFGLSS